MAKTMHRSLRALDYAFRPKHPLKSGWVNIYPAVRGHEARAALIYETRERADDLAYEDRIACIRIEWEEPT